MSDETENGDHGMTSLLYGGRVSKVHPVIDCAGQIDELNAHIGLCAAEPIRSLSWTYRNTKTGEVVVSPCIDSRYWNDSWECVTSSSTTPSTLHSIQERVGHLRSEVCCADRKKYAAEKPHITDESLVALGALFVPSNSKSCAQPRSQFDLAVRVCHRAERALLALRLWEDDQYAKVRSPILLEVPPDAVYLQNNIKVRPILITYLNRLASYLQLLARR